jgi:hypothetical protein
MCYIRVFVTCVGRSALYTHEEDVVRFPLLSPDRHDRLDHHNGQVSRPEDSTAHVTGHSMRQHADADTLDRWVEGSRTADRNHRDQSLGRAHEEGRTHPDTVAGPIHAQAVGAETQLDLP